MTTPIDDPARTNGRFVRNLALSISGGTLLTLLGATAAHAQDAAQASTDSSGTGAAHSGDASAVGNQSGTNNTQTVTVSGNLGTIQVINQQANVSNTGAAVANTGGNIAIGNSSNNGSKATQNAATGGGTAANDGAASNASGGTATVNSGNASAVGNRSNTTINQEAHGSAHGQLGGILVINQDATVTNSGVALANSGANRADGNESDNTAGLLQGSDVAGGIASNNGKASNASDGKGTVNSGNAAATGNQSNTSITQSATGDAGGELGGLVIIGQNANVLNTGAAVANTGANRADGNTSNGAAALEQSIGGTAPVFDPVGVASNNGEASNTSDGTGGITTGDASAVGNDSTTTVKQHADSHITGDGGLNLVTQDSNVTNTGIALANSGGNQATGNDSDNGNIGIPGAQLVQTAPSAGAVDVGVIGNFGKAANDSDGTGSVHSGGAFAAGNRSQTDVDQSATSDGGALNLYTQGNTVTNVGVGVANSGLNETVGNDSNGVAAVAQSSSLPVDGVDVGVIGNFGKAGNASDGTASITTGNASAVGNESKTVVGQTIDPDGVVIANQGAAVLNAGAAAANTGGNTATGNDSSNTSGFGQTADIGANDAVPPTITAGTLVGSNNGEASNTSDGTATIATGNAAATGNSSNTAVAQDSTGEIDGLGLVLNTQLAGVVNVGGAVANSGGNDATGNESDNEAQGGQEALVGSGNADPTTIDAGVLTASNDGTSANTSDGTAAIATGDAAATGNRSATRLSQREGGSVDGLGAVLNTQVGTVANVGVGVANSGGNTAIGNTSNGFAVLTQGADIGSLNDDPTDIDAGTITAANSGTAENTSDGTAKISTGSAQATGNSSATDLAQAQDGTVDALGLVLNTQLGGVVNAGVGVANSGLNRAVGNTSDNTGPGGTPGAILTQVAEVGSQDADDVSITAPVAIAATNSGKAANTSDGTAEIRTGGAQGQGNVSTTSLSQAQDGTVGGTGAAIDTQVGGVANVGVGVANTGLDLAIGNTSDNDGIVGTPGAVLDRSALIGSQNPAGTVDLTAGSATATNSGEASNTSDGSAKISTGGALATGNASATNLYQHQTNDVDALGLVLSTQLGGVANAGLGVANSGLNAAVGNTSDNVVGADQDAELVSDNATPVSPLTITGAAAANNSGEATNSSDGDAVVRTGGAVATGNASSTTLVQDLDNQVGTGTVIVTEAGGVLNAGLGLANSGLNLAVGNTSDNTATADQDWTINDALTPGIVGPQIAHNGGGATNDSAGAGKVGSGNASATGNASTTNFVQAAAIDSDFAVANIVGGTTNTGLGLANSGLNLGIGNASTNVADLTQNADGAGLVSNDGTASNDSDGTGIVGNPDEPTTPLVVTHTPTPGRTALPTTGGPLEVEAAIGLMLLLAGFGLRRKGARTT